MSEIGERIRDLRIKLEWTQDLLAQKIGTSKYVISNWERGLQIQITNKLFFYATP